MYEEMIYGEYDDRKCFLNVMVYSFSKCLYDDYMLGIELLFTVYTYKDANYKKFSPLRRVFLSFFIFILFIIR